MALYKITNIKAVYCPKRRDFVFLSDCEKCEYFRGVKRYLTHTYVDCGFWDEFFDENSLTRGDEK